MRNFFFLCLLATTFICTHAVGVEDEQLVFKKNYQKTLIAITKGKWDEALYLMDTLYQSELKKPDEFDFYYGKVLFQNRYYNRSIYKLKQYLGNISEGRNLTEAKELLPLAVEQAKYIYELKRVFFDGSVYEGGMYDMKPYGKGKMIWIDGSTYEGEWQGNDRSGKGKNTSVFGEIYEGIFKNNIKHGIGKLTWPDGSVYEGNFAYNVMEGDGTYTSKDGSKYIGNWFKGKRNGKGKQIYKDGEVLEGSWRDDEFVSGDYTRNDKKQFSDGRIFEGLMTNDTPSGNGKMIFPSGIVMIGKFAGELLNDENGEIRWPNKSYYKGSVKNGCVEGRGSYFFGMNNEFLADFPRTCVNLSSHLMNQYIGKGSFYIGSERNSYIGDFAYGFINGYGTRRSLSTLYNGYFKNNHLHGKGELKYLIDEDEEYWVSYVGDFVEDKWEGKGTLKLRDGSIYIGDFFQNMQHGNGMLKFPSGNIYEGQFKFNNQHGKGTISWKNGDKYVGDWLDGVRTGKGIYTWPSGEIHKGNWLNNKRQGYGWSIDPSGKVKKGYWKNDEFDKACRISCKDPIEE